MPATGATQVLGHLTDLPKHVDLAGQTGDEA